MLTWNFSEFVARAGKEQELGALVFHVYSLPHWTKFTVEFCRSNHFSEQEPTAQNQIKPLCVSVQVNLPLQEAFISILNLTKTYLRSSRVQLVHILHSNL